MFELTYRSEAQKNIIREDIVNILESATKFNLENNITGCLVFYDNHFIQILEGEKKVVKNIFSKISTDPRHFSVQVLSEGAKEDRFFPDWNMAFTDVSKNQTTDEVVNYANNLILLSEFIEKPTTTLMMFWAGINRIIKTPA